MHYFHRDKHYQYISFIGIQINDETTGLLRYQTYLQYCQQHQLISQAQLGELNYQSGYLLAKQALAKQASSYFMCDRLSGLWCTKIFSRTENRSY